MAVKKINADLRVLGRILCEFADTHYLDEATDFKGAMTLLDSIIAQTQSYSVTEDLSAQADGTTDTFTTSNPFTEIRIILNGLEQSEGADNDYIIIDTTHIQFYRPIKTTENIIVEYIISQ